MSDEQAATKALPIAIPEYHQSAINMFLKCPRQYMFRYLMGLILPPKSALTVGRSMDAAFTHNFKQKVMSKQDLPLSDVVDAFSSEFDRCSSGTDWNGEDPGEQKDLGIKMTKAFQEKASAKIQPKTVQESARVETDAGYALAGTFDVVDEQDIIRDQKSSKTEYPTDAVSNEVQPAVYDFLYTAKHGKKPKAFAFDVITKHKKEPRYQEVTGEVTEAQTNQLFESINIMHGQIQRGEFQYAPSGAWWCSKDWCGYWHLCKGKR